MFIRMERGISCSFVERFVSCLEADYLGWAPADLSARSSSGKGWRTSPEHGADGFFVLREVALDFGQIERAKDARVWFALKEEFERLLNQFLWRDASLSELLPVFGKDGHHVRGGCLVPDGDLEGCLVHLFDGDVHGIAMG